MAKSQIIKDLINKKAELTQALERVLVIAMEINDADTVKWVKQEKNGYSENDAIPSYRRVSLIPMGSYQMVGWGHIYTYQHRALPTLGVPEEIKELYQNHHFKQGLSQIIEQYNESKGNENRIGIPIQPEHYYMFEKDTNINITNAYLYYSQFDLEKIIDAVRTRTIELLVLLEKNFGVLDDLDISIDDYKNEEILKLQEACAMVINGNNSGDTYIITDSKIKKSIVGKENSISKESRVEVNPEILSGSENKKSFWKWLVGLFGRK